MEICLAVLSVTCLGNILMEKVRGHHGVGHTCRDRAVLGGDWARECEVEERGRGGELRRTARGSAAGKEAGTRQGQEQPRGREDTPEGEAAAEVRG